MSLAPDWGGTRLGAMLSGEVEESPEVAALALGGSRREDALEALLAALSEEVLSRRRLVLIRALGMHRSDRAVEALQAIVDESDQDDAAIAAEALAARRP